MMRYTLLALPVFTTACASAASSPPRSGPDTPADVTTVSTGINVRLSEDHLRSTVVFQVPLDSVWMQLPLVYQALGIAPEVMDTRTRTFGTQRFTNRRVAGMRTLAFVDCAHEGAGPSAANPRRVELSILSTLQPLESGDTELTIQVAGVATAVDGTNTAPVRCTSNGRLEQRIAEMLAAELSTQSRDGA